MIYSTNWFEKHYMNERRFYISHHISLYIYRSCYQFINGGKSLIFTLVVRCMTFWLDLKIWKLVIWLERKVILNHHLIKL